MGNTEGKSVGSKVDRTVCSKSARVDPNPVDKTADKAVCSTGATMPTTVVTRPAGIRSCLSDASAEFSPTVSAGFADAS